MSIYTDKYRRNQLLAFLAPMCTFEEILAHYLGAQSYMTSWGRVSSYFASHHTFSFANFFRFFQIMVVKDIEREDIEHVCKSLGCGPIASLDHFTADKLASAELVEEVQTGASKTVRVTGIAKQVVI